VAIPDSRSGRPSQPQLGHSPPLSTDRSGADLLTGAVGWLSLTGNHPVRAELSASEGYSHVLVGAGSVLDAASVAKAGEAGERFYVSPVLQGRAIPAAKELGMASVLGCATPTEMIAAYAAGAAAVRVLPATLWNPDDLANVLRAMPFLALVPTGGIGTENAAAWLAAGSTTLGIGSSLTAAEGNVADLRRAISPHSTGRNP